MGARGGGGSVLEGGECCGRKAEGRRGAGVPDKVSGKAHLSMGPPSQDWKEVRRQPRECLGTCTERGWGPYSDPEEGVPGMF